MGENDKLQKPVQATNGLANKSKLKIPALHSRVMNQAVQAPSPIDLPNRIMLMPDCSGSMASSDEDGDYNRRGGTPKIDILRDAVDSFLNAVTWHDTAVGIRNFGSDREGLDANLTDQSALLRLSAMLLEACGSTPMGAAMQSAIKEPITRGIIISDGDSTDGDLSLEMAKQFREASVPVDCIHLGHSQSGEERLKQIAELTGGIYAKIKYAQNLIGALKYLTPSYRGLLMSGDAASLLGATEVKQGNKG